MLANHLSIDFSPAVHASSSLTPHIQPETLYNTTLGGWITCKQIHREWEGGVVDYEMG